MNRPQPWHALFLCVLTFFPFSRLYANSSSVDLSPNSLNLGSQVIASTSGAGSVTLTSHLNSPLSIFTISTVGDFTQTNNCQGLLQPGHSCAIKVTFTPSAVGARSGQLVVTHNDDTSPQSISLSGTATGLSSIAILQTRFPSS